MILYEAYNLCILPTKPLTRFLEGSLLGKQEIEIPIAEFEVLV